MGGQGVGGSEDAATWASTHGRSSNRVRASPAWVLKKKKYFTTALKYCAEGFFPIVLSESDIYN